VEIVKVNVLSNQGVEAEKEKGLKNKVFEIS